MNNCKQWKLKKAPVFGNAATEKFRNVNWKTKKLGIRNEIQ